ncbi:ACP phosphodiesterase [Thalassotalea atypica]|uniref:acyl carrier protein phosphodiesterase n=1 Tax=Thalassotalea atypica TaxID=2054316 RepID=UPI0025744EE8|nr:ACP phosphodiesterase [Thalassotalea atypica]
MNYLAHLYLAQPNADSHYGNLLGDFGGMRKVKTLPTAVIKGLDNHYLVDRYTDNHDTVKQAKHLFSPKRRRFAGIAIDVLFDHFLIQHWSRFEASSHSQFKRSSYRLLTERIHVMPARMQHVIYNLTTNDWFNEYETLSGVGIALDNIAKRIRFANEFNGAIEDIERHYGELEAIFLMFFPQLIEHVKSHGLETNNEAP